MYAAYFLAGQTTDSSSALHSSQILGELNFCLFLSSNFKMNGKFGFVQRNGPLQSLHLTVPYPLQFFLESFFHGRLSRHLLSKSAQLDPFMEYTFIPSISNDISITFRRSIFSQVFSPKNLCPCKSNIIVVSSSLSLVLQLESPTRIKKYVRLYKWTDSEDTEIIRISTLWVYLILILLGGAYWRRRLK